jgi:hypothetical protein
LPQQIAAAAKTRRRAPVAFVHAPFEPFGQARDLSRERVDERPPFWRHRIAGRERGDGHVARRGGACEKRRRGDRAKRVPPRDHGV